MKPFSVAAAVAVIATVMAAGQARQPADPQAAVKQEIMRIENERNRAVVDGDAAALDRLTAADYSFITLRGELRTKDEIVKGFKSGSFHYDTRTISDSTVPRGRRHRRRGRPLEPEGHRERKDYSGDYRFTRVYVKQNGHWQTVALQTTLIQP